MPTVIDPNKPYRKAPHIQHDTRLLAERNRAIQRHYAHLQELRNSIPQKQEVVKHVVQNNSVPVDHAQKSQARQASSAHKSKRNSFSLFNAPISAYAALFVFSLSFFSIMLASFYITSPSSTPQVAGVSETIEVNQEYDFWIQQKTGELLAQDTDSDEDGLTNFEEFIFNTNPIVKIVCENEKTDIQNIFAGIDPTSCNELEEGGERAQLFDSFLSNAVLKDLLDETNGVNTTEQLPSGIKNVFGVDSYDEISANSVDDVQYIIEQKQKKIEYLELIENIDEYIKQNRSYEPYDRNLAVPVHSAIFVDVSERYNVPLKFVLTIAQLESRFGTDRFTQTGELTRPGQYENMYSMGLDDSGNNINYGGWEAGVEAFGMWYQRFENAGVSDCRKWRIYNPNGDYCAKVTELANYIDQTVITTE